jgi:structural maintenance of chromosome 2
VQNLFHSVQLNVNNPHFLIMQGRITKVLNMKPVEILSMLEEAAGTRMYEVKKEGALKTLEKKQGKLDEIDTVLQNDVRPALENLRKERALYMNWTVGQTEVQRLKRLCIAHSFTMAERTVTDAVDEVEELKRRLAELSASAEALQAEINQKAQDIAKLTEEKDKQMGQEVKTLQGQADEASKQLVKDTTNWTNKKELHESEKDGLKQVRSSMFTCLRAF